MLPSPSFRFRPLAVGIVSGALFLLIGGFAVTTAAQPIPYRIQERVTPSDPLWKNWKDCGLRKKDLNAFTSRRPAPISKQAATANIEVDYSGFPAEARTAFQRAVNIWERHIKSSVTIRIDASFESLEPGVLGGTRPNFVYALDRNDDGTFDLSVVDALIDALTGEDQQPSEPDMLVSMNSDRDDWHFGEGDAPAGKIDFTTIVLHEITHGLGYLAATDVTGETGEYGINFSESNEPIPLVYTTFLAERIDGSQVFLTNESEYPNPSDALGEALQGDRLVFDGPSARSTAGQGNGPVPPKVYAPVSYNPGSSISHLDEQTYPAGSSNALMTPATGAAETNRLPGPIVCGQLDDMLWPLGSGCRRYFTDVFGMRFAEAPDPANGRVTLSWDVREDTTINEFVVEKKAFTGSFEPVRRVDGPPVTIDSLGLGTFAFRVRWTTSDGSDATTPTSVQTTFRTRNVSSVLGERDDQGRASVSVSWDVPPGTRGYTYQVERRLGTEGEFETVASVDQKSVTLRRQTPGTYVYRVSASDENNNTVTGTETEEVRIDFDGAVYTLGPYPNPVQNAASFDLTAQTEQAVTIEVYDVTGRRVYDETRRLAAQAPERITIDTRNWSSGMYFFRVQGEEFAKTEQMIVAQ